MLVLGIAKQRLGARLVPARRLGRARRTCCAPPRPPRCWPAWLSLRPGAGGGPTQSSPSAWPRLRSARGVRPGAAILLHRYQLQVLGGSLHHRLCRTAWWLAGRTRGGEGRQVPELVTGGGAEHLAHGVLDLHCRVLGQADLAGEAGRGGTAVKGSHQAATRQPPGRSTRCSSASPAGMPPQKITLLTETT
jgi:hypothetical protein